MKSIWKMIVKCVCVMMPFLVLGVHMERSMMAFSDEEVPYYIWNRDKANSAHDGKYRVVVLGDSTANASYVPEALSGDTINLSLGGTTPMENYFTLRDWLDHNPAPDACYLSFLDDHFQADGTFWTRTMRSHRYRFWQNLEMLRSAVSFNEPSILTEHYLLDFISYQLYLPNKYVTSFMNASFNQRYEANSNAVRADELHGGRYIARGTAEYVATEPIVFEEFLVNPLFDSYYRKIIELCGERSIRLRIVKLPLPESSQFTEGYKESFHAYYDSLQKEYPFITVDWFSPYPDNRFVDAHHMNSHGALQFSEELKARHPEDFSAAEKDESQIAAIEDSIRGENQIEWILKWASEAGDAVLFYDKRGEFGEMYAERLGKEWGTDGSGLRRVPIEDGGTAGDGDSEGKGDAEGDDRGENDDAAGVDSDGKWDAAGDGDSMKNGEAEGAGDAITEGESAAGKSEKAGSPDIWEIAGEGAGDAALHVTEAREGLLIEIGGQEPVAWNTAYDDVLGVAVINPYSHSVVCTKSFRYVDEDFAFVGG